MARFGTLGTQYFDSAGNPLVNGLILFEESGTSTKKDTFADPNLSIKNTNPVQLTGDGRQPNVWFNGTAKATLFTSSGEQVEVRDPLGGDSSEGSFSPWNSLTIYEENDIVEGSDSVFYISLTNNNQGNDPAPPTSNRVNWTEIRFIRIWNSNETYNANRVVQGSNGLLYTSQINGNIGNDPTSDFINWRPATDSNLPPVVRSASKSYANQNFG